MKKNICLFFACSLLSFNYVFSQVIVRGSVIDASTSEPLIGATIIYGKGMGAVTDIDGNTLVLFNYVEKHGEPLYEMINSKGGDKRIFFIHGKVPTDEREEARQICENTDNAIILASYGTFSTGINIKNLHNVIFASPSKLDG